MNLKFKKIIVLLFIFILSSLFFIKQEKLSDFKILKIIEADTFYIDINNNNLIDGNELFHLNGAKAFNSNKDEEATNFCKENDFDINDYLKNGVLAQNWAKENLENKFVKIKKYKNYKVDIYFNNQNLAEFLLKNGLAYPSTKESKYFEYSNFKQAKNNANSLSSLEFVIINLKNGITHKINCEYANKIKNAKLELKNKAKYSKLCKFCFDFKNNDLNQKFKHKIPKSKKIYKKSINKTFKDIEIYLLNPLEYKKPNKACTTDFCKRIVTEINNSKNSIDLALYGIGEQEEIIQALRNAKERGVEIKSVTDFTKKSENKYENTDNFIKEFSATTDKNEILMHNKFFIFDNQTVITGSTNISSTGSGGYNSNIGIIINNKEISKIYKKEFEQMHKGKFSINKNKISKENLEDIKVYFLPKDNVLEDEILPSIKNAKRTILISAFYLTERNLINEIILAQKRGVEIYIILDATSAKNFSKLVIELRENKIPVIVENWGGKNHEKTMVIDTEKIITGSANFSRNGFYKNDENIISITNPDMAIFYSDYFMYLFNSINQKFLYSIPKAEGVDSINSCNDGIDNDHDKKIDTEEMACSVKNNKN